MPAKRQKLAPLLPTPKVLKGILSVDHMKEMSSTMRKKVAGELTDGMTNKIPKCTLAGNKTFAASYSMEVGKSIFHFEAITQKEEHVEIILSEKGMDSFMEKAEVFVEYAKKLESIKQGHTENSEIPQIPEPKILEIIEKEGGLKYEIILSAFRFTQGTGCCISIKECNTANKQEYKQWLLNGPSFVYFVKIIVPFFSDFYRQYADFIDNVREVEGLEAYDGSLVGSWKKKITTKYGY
jgi:hypothetical protein